MSEPLWGDLPPPGAGVPSVQSSILSPFSLRRTAAQALLDGGCGVRQLATEKDHHVVQRHQADQLAFAVHHRKATHSVLVHQVGDLPQAGLDGDGRERRLDQAVDGGLLESVMTSAPTE
jgi:hypothetical protein